MTHSMRMYSLQIPGLLFCILFGFAGPSLVSAESQDQVSIAGGEVKMGSTLCSDQFGNADWCSDETVHTVRINPFMIDKYEVTNEAYKACFAEGVCGPNELHDSRPDDFNKPRQPVMFVTWEDAQTYCKWKGGRLPTEAEWERAAQADFAGEAVFGQKYNVGAPSEVGSVSPSSNGIFDMFGNVAEWTADWYAPYPTGETQENPSGPKEGKDKVIRGGSWTSAWYQLRASDRVARTPDLRYSDLGFRCIREMK